MNSSRNGKLKLQAHVIPIHAPKRDIMCFQLYFLFISHSTRPDHMLMGA